jgi:hypothetical protein
MDRSEVIKLIRYEYIQNEFGVRDKYEVIERRVFCNVDTVTGREYFEGGANGIKPEYRITMFKYDYDGEEIIEYKGELYQIYRSYFSTKDMIELYVEKRKGVE